MPWRTGLGHPEFHWLCPVTAVEGLGIKFARASPDSRYHGHTAGLEVREAVLHFLPNLILRTTLGSTAGHLRVVGGSESGTARAPPCTRRWG